VIEDALLGKAAPWDITLRADGKVLSASGAAIRQGKQGPLSWQVRDAMLPEPPPPEPVRDREWPARRMLHIHHLPTGAYRLCIDGQPVATASAKAWEDGVAVHDGPEFEQAEHLRRTIVEKNRLYFNRWRPENETYLFGFRKHEQGRNAVEIPRFDPLVVAREKAIAQLKVPKTHTYQLKRIAEQP
jgi:hypothetical protein